MKLFTAFLLSLFSIFYIPLVFSQEVEWDISVGVDDTIYPSFIMATSTLKTEDTDNDKTQLGDPMGFIGVNIKSPKDQTKVVVELSSNKLIKKSSFDGTLEKAGETYYVCPILQYDYDTLLGIRQPFPEIVTAKVFLDGKLLGEKSKRVPVRSINDCVIAFEEDGKAVNSAWLMSAYVNENHPFIDTILKETLDEGAINSFAGYQKSQDEVLEEMKAIWNNIQNRGFRYSNITRSSGESKTVACQHVRLIGDAIKTAQANCVEGSVLFASIFRKLEMDPFLVLIPGHMFVGVYLDAKHENYICIETTMVGTSTFEDAVEQGRKTFEENLDKFPAGEEAEEAGAGKKETSKPNEEAKEKPAEEAASGEYQIIDIAASREMGVMPIREAGADDKANEAAE